MRRREFIALLGSATAAWLSAARAQQSTTPVVGFLNSLRESDRPNLQAAFRRGLGEAGYVDGKNVTIEYRYADNQHNRLPTLAADLVSRKVAVIAATGGGATILAAMAATKTIPIVFTTGSDPVDAGMVASISRPGGNVTGATSLQNYVAGKQLGLIRDMVPKLATIGFLASPLVPMIAVSTRDIEAAAQKVGLKAVVINVSSESDFDSAFAQFSQQRVDALIVSSGAFFNRYLDRMATLTRRYAIPAIFISREYAVAGGLMSYGPAFGESNRQAGLYVARILRGDRPADLPVMQPTRSELVINMKTVMELGLTVPPGLLAIADEVIE